MSTTGIAFMVWIMGSAAVAFFALFLFGSFRTAGVALLALALGVGAALGRDLIRLTACGAPAEGVIEQLTWERRTVRPVVRFTTPDGQDVQFRCRQGVSPGVYEVGQWVPVYYLPSDPSFAVVATVRSLWMSLAGGMAFELLVLAAGLYLVTRGRPRWPKT